MNMIAHFDLPFEIEDSSKIVYRLNSLLPKDISIDSIFEVEESMHARFSAKSRTYKYYVSTKKSPFDDEFSARITFSFLPILYNLLSFVFIIYAELL